MVVSGLYGQLIRRLQMVNWRLCQWIRANGGEWTDDAADHAARNGHLETLKWIRANGGEWTSKAADWAC